MQVYFDVDERSLLRYRGGLPEEEGRRQAAAADQGLEDPVDVALDGDEGYPRRGVIDFADNRVNPSTGTIQVRGELPNADRMLDHGMRAQVRIPVSEPHKVLMVTARALGTDQGRRFVYVVNGEDVVERRDVKLGRLVDGMQVIEAGLQPDDRVVVNGIQRVRDGTKVAPRTVPMPGETPVPSAPTAKS